MLLIILIDVQQTISTTKVIIFISVISILLKCLPKKKNNSHLFYNFTEGN